MTIIEKNKEDRIYFDEIDNGDVFKSGNEFFMKIRTDIGEEPDNAVSLQTGECEFFTDYDMVIPIRNVKLVIE